MKDLSPTNSPATISQTFSRLGEALPSLTQRRADKLHAPMSANERMPSAASANDARHPFGDSEAVPARIFHIAAMRGLGYSYREIGQRFAVTPQAVSVMLQRYRRSIERLDDASELRGLSARAVNALGRHRIRSRKEGKKIDLLGLLRSERNCGRKTMEEIARWLEGHPR